MKKLVIYILFTQIMIGYRLIGQERSSKLHEVLFKGNKFQLAQATEKDTIYMTDPITHKTYSKVIKVRPFPVTMNGKHIYNGSEISISHQDRPQNMPIEDQILNNFKRDFPADSFDDGGIEFRFFSRIVIDEKGSVVYSDLEDVLFVDKEKIKRNIGILGTQHLFENINMPTASYKAKKVPYMQRVFLKNYAVEIRNHVLTYRKI